MNPLRRWRERYRREPNPVFRAMLGLTALLLALSACAFSAAAAVYVFDRGWSQFGPGGVFSPLRTGQAAPDFKLQALDGRTVALSDFQGRPVAINFWATWCLPCVAEMPVLNAAQREHADTGLVVLGLNAGERRDVVARFAAQHGLEYAVLLDAGSRVASQYGLVDMPTTLWIDAAGVLRAADYGKITAEQIADRVADLRGPPTQVEP